MYPFFLKESPPGSDPVRNINCWCLYCLGGKLASLEEFKVQKEDLMAKFASMEEQLKLQEENHKDVIYNLERKQVVDKDRYFFSLYFTVLMFSWT